MGGLGFQQGGILESTETLVPVGPSAQDVVSEWGVLREMVVRLDGEEAGGDQKYARVFKDPGNLTPENVECRKAAHLRFRCWCPAIGAREDRGRSVSPRSCLIAGSCPRKGDERTTPILVIGDRQTRLFAPVTRTGRERELEVYIQRLRSALL